MNSLFYKKEWYFTYIHIINDMLMVSSKRVLGLDTHSMLIRNTFMNNLCYLKVIPVLMYLLVDLMALFRQYCFWNKNWFMTTQIWFKQFITSTAVFYQTNCLNLQLPTLTPMLQWLYVRKLSEEPICSKCMRGGVLVTREICHSQQQSWQRGSRKFNKEVKKKWLTLMCRT